jgi:hypothetical protein
LGDALKDMSPSLCGLCDCFFRLEGSVTRLQDVRSRVRDVMLSLNVRDAYALEATALVDVLTSQLEQFRQITNKRFVLSKWTEDKAWPL